MFATAGWVKPFDPASTTSPPQGVFPVVLIYQAGAATVTDVTITVTLHNAAVFVNSTPAADSGNGTAGSPLVYTIPAVAANGTGQIVIEARAKSLT